MKYISIIFCFLFYVLIVVTSCRSKDLSDPGNKLTGKVETLQLRYIAWGCACANWVTEEDLKKYQDSGLADNVIFIEPSTPELKVPVYFDVTRHYIRVKGQFYVDEGYPKGTVESEENLDPAKVFRYTSIEVVNIPFEYPPEFDTTLVLSYSAIGCTCPQWTPLRDAVDSLKVYYYLERGDTTLLDADELFDGSNIPLTVQVTGQWVSENGLPTGFEVPKGKPEYSKVFRYTKIKVLESGRVEKNVH
jgi:hypothetical protein